MIKTSVIDIELFINLFSLEWFYLYIEQADPLSTLLIIISCIIKVEQVPLGST